jgi:hypothetical protein
MDSFQVGNVTSQERNDMRSDIFGKVAKHLLTQNAKSQSFFGDCRYRGPNGLKCAIGCLIPDDQYSESFEHSALTTVRQRVPLLSLMPYELVRDLQEIHDCYEPVEWPSKLELIRKKYNIGETNA